MMLDLFRNLLSPDRYMPYGQCYLWQTPLIALHGMSDGLMTIAYFSILAMLGYFIQKRKDLPFSHVFVLFGAFIVLCGTGYLLDIWTLWHPAYWLSGGVRALTALVACYVALQLSSLLPLILALKTPSALEAINQQLQQEMGERRRAEETLQKIVAGTASVTGSEFFPALVQQLAIALEVPYAMVSERLHEQPQQVRTLAAWLNQTLAENETISLAGNPCEGVIQKGQLLHYPDTLQERFPASAIVKALQAESYLGVPLIGASGDVIGNLCLLHTQPLTVDENQHAIVRVFAARAAAELERQWAEQARNRAYEALGLRVDERTSELLDMNTILETEIQERIAAEAELQRMAERERAATQVILRMRQSLDLEDIFSTTTVELRQAMRCDRTLIYRFNPDWSGSVVAESVSPAWNAIIPYCLEDVPLTQVAVDQPNCIIKRFDGNEVMIQDTYLQANEGGFYREKTNYCCVPDIYAAGFNACYLELLETLQARAYVTVPIFCGSHLWGLLAVYQNSAPRHWHKSEIRIVSQISSQLGVALQQAELFAQTQQQAAALQEAKEIADAANRAKSEFLASMSHELRTPLNAVLGFTQLMSSDLSLTPTQQEHLGIINRSGEHLLKLINDVLEMSKIEAGKAALDVDRFDLYHLLQKLEEMLHLRAHTKNLQFAIVCSEDVPQFVIADEGKLQQVLINLLGNAIKFTQQGSVTLRVSTSAPPHTNSPQTPHQPLPEEPQLRLCFVVEDTGAGMSLEEQQNLFKPFEQTRTGSAASEGTGLGLAISQKFVQLMDGNITVTSQYGQGSSFSFTIPVRYATAIAAPPPQPITQTVIGLAPGQPNYRILIAEDNGTNRYLLSQMLRMPGFELKEVDNGRDAVTLCQQWQPHLIFMDMQMPVMNGIEATRQIKANVETQQTMIIALTASAFEEQRRAFLTAGCDDFLSKPFQRLTLFTKISQHLGVRYLYGPTATQTLQSKSRYPSPPQLSECDLKASLAQQPQPWRTELHRAALEGSDTRVFELLHQIPSTQMSLKEAISVLAEGFQFDQILTLLSSQEAGAIELELS